MTKENNILYFKNKYIYNTLISISLFLSVFSYCSTNNINLFIWVLTIFYGIDVVFKLSNLHISLKHRTIAFYFDKAKYQIGEMLVTTALKVIEFGIYMTVALNMFKVDGVLFGLSMFIVMVAMIRIMLTVFFVGHSFLQNLKNNYTPLEIPKEFQHYLTKNRLNIHRISGEFDFPEKIIDHDIEIFQMNDPNQVDKGYKTYHQIDVLKYHEKLYDVKKLNDYLNQNNKDFRLLTYKELDLLKM